MRNQVAQLIRGDLAGLQRHAVTHTRQHRDLRSGLGADGVGEQTVGGRLPVARFGLLPGEGLRAGDKGARNADLFRACRDSCSRR